MPAEVKEEQSSEGPSALALSQEPKEPPGEPAATNDDLDTPTSNASAVTSTNDSSTETDTPLQTDTEEAKHAQTPDTCVPLLPPDMEDAVPPDQPPEEDTGATKDPPSNESMIPSATLIPTTSLANTTTPTNTITTTPSNVNAIFNITTNTIPSIVTTGDDPTNANLTAPASTIFTPPAPRPTDPPPDTPDGLGLLNLPGSYGGHGGNLCVGYGSLSRGVHHSYWPPRNYPPGGHYTLPLPRDNYGPGGQERPREGPGETQEVKAEYPASSYPTLGGVHQFRPITTMELLREPSRTRGGYEDGIIPQVDVDPGSFFHTMSRAQTLQFPHKRSSMVSLDGIRRDPRWRDPNLREVITMLSHPMDPVKSNAAAYLQHLCYENDRIKQDVRHLKGLPVLVDLLDHPKAEVHRKACGALRNISYGKDHDNKVAIQHCDGLPALVRLLRKSSNMEVRELVTGTLWNLSSHEPLKMMVINHGLQTLTDEVIIPHSGWRRDPTEHSRPRETEWTTVFKNTSGCLRNVSSDGAEARQRLRECEGLVDALLHALQSAVATKDTDNKSVENCVCILRNLSYHVHKEVPGAERFQEPPANYVPRSGGQQQKKKTTEADCFGGKRAKELSFRFLCCLSEEWFNQGWRNGLLDKKYETLDLPKRREPMKGLDLLYQPEVVRLYLSLLTRSQNHNTLEAAAGALQNLAAGHWAWSSYIRATVRKEKGLPVLVELLRSDADKVVRAVAIALRNLAIDRRNKDLIGGYAMRDLVSNLPCGQQRPAKNLEGDTVVAILNTIHEIITDSLENTRGLIQGHAIQKLIAINKTSQSVRETKVASHVLQTVWAYKDLRNNLFKAGWNKSHFKPTTTGVTKKNKNTKQGYDDITLPLMEKNQEGYSVSEQADRVAEGPGHVMEREAFQTVPERKHFIRAVRPSVGLVDRKPPPLDSWV
ncbi:splicing regulator ARVCF isoform X1 [Osmerus eperlanus]|uniref:splicing regulator ARVCF isoform X1 n=1 Tax=Osmerus eperlanus TaxID=29151 RepID=UPI002E0DD322